MSLTWLHISDFHIRGGDPYDRDVVLRALVASVAEYRKRGRSPDLIFATGDIAHAGKAEEYLIATQFFDKILEATGLDKHSLFVIPGNHDVDRTRGLGLVRTLESRENADAYFYKDYPKLHLTFKLGEFLKWHNAYFEGIRAIPGDSTCGPVELVERQGHRLGILPVNSALFCQGDDDHDKLWIGRRRLDEALVELKALKAELNVVLIHHPLEWLSATEGSNIQAMLESSADILLRGHLHETRIESVASPEGEMLRCAAGAAYQTRQWPNRAMYATFDGRNLSVFPIRYEDSPREVWTTDPSAFPSDPGHERSFPVPRLTRSKADPPPSTPANVRAPATGRFRGNIVSRGNRPFVGREDLLAIIETDLGPPSKECVIVLHGLPGVGKSELAREFGRTRRDRYPGGTFWLDASTSSLDIHLATIGKTILDLDFPPDLKLDDQGRKTFYSLGTEPTLLIYDNVVVFDRIDPWLPPSGMPCHVLITSLAARETIAWPIIEVNRLTHAQSLLLVEKITGADVAARYGEAIIARAGGLPVQIVPEASALAYDVRRGRKPSVGMSLARSATDSFRAAYDRLDQPAQLLLHAAAIFTPQRIPIAELGGHLRDGIGWSPSEAERALDLCFDLHLLEGSRESDATMHQLFATFVRETAPSAGNQELLAKVRAAQERRFVEVATAVGVNPADTQNAATLIGYPLTPLEWEAASQLPSIEAGSTIGRALYEIGRFEDARPWLERAVAAKEKGDEHGLIDHDSLARSLHQVGYCLWSLGQYSEARPWFERAITEKEKGDVNGRVDQDSLGRSLHEVGQCLASTGEYSGARSWYERAVAAKEKGDEPGLIDHDSLGSSLHQVGYCLSSSGQYSEAQPWFERAITEKEKGDEHGFINHEGLGRSLNQVGYCLWRLRKYSEARLWYERAVLAKEKGDFHGRIDHDSLGRGLNQVGYCLWSGGQYSEAQPWFERAVAAKKKGDVYGRIDHQSLALSLDWVADCLSSSGQEGEAQPYRERANAARDKAPAASK